MDALYKLYVVIYGKGMLLQNNTRSITRRLEGKYIHFFTWEQDLEESVPFILPKVVHSRFEFPTSPVREDEIGETKKEKDRE